MRKVISSVAIIVMLISLAGCGSTSERYPSNARGVVNAFMGKLVEGNFESALLYCEEDGDAYQTISSITEAKLVNEFAMTFSDSEEDCKEIEENKYIQKWIHSYYEYMFKNYQIVDFREEKKECIYEVGASRIESDENALFGYLTGSDVFYNYYYDNQEELDAMIENEGENAVIVKFVKENAKELADSYMNALKNNAHYSNRNYYITLKKIDGEWKITKFNLDIFHLLKISKRIND